MIQVRIDEKDLTICSLQPESYDVNYIYIHLTTWGRKIEGILTLKIILTEQTLNTSVIRSWKNNCASISLRGHANDQAINHYTDYIFIFE